MPIFLYITFENKPVVRYTNKLYASCWKKGVPRTTEYAIKNKTAFFFLDFFVSFWGNAKKKKTEQHIVTNFMQPKILKVYKKRTFEVLKN